MSKKLVQENVELFRCPICGSKMDIQELKRLICAKNHCFDLSKSGYINFLINAVKTEYDKEMFKSRNMICKSDFFEPMAELVSEITDKFTCHDESEPCIILDAGCGEGSHLNQIKNKLCNKGFKNYISVGIDISKEGIKIASKEYPDNIWCVGDIARIPLLNKKVHVILNILTPSNYSEFSRILTDTGVLVKVIPGSSYLKELRELLYDKTDKQEYSNEKVIKHFQNNFRMLDKNQVLYTVKINNDYLEHLIKMTPLSWSASNEKIRKVYSSGLKTITVDFTIICGKKD